MKQLQKCVYVAFTTPPNLKELEVKLEEVRKEKDAAVQSQEFEKAASLRDSEQRLREAIRRYEKSMERKTRKRKFRGYG